MHTLKAEGRITGYRFVGPAQEREPQLLILFRALQALTPGSIDEDLSDKARQNLAAVSLQLAAFLEDWDSGSTLAKDARSVLSGIRTYLLHRRQRLMDAGYGEAVTSAVVTPGYAYFDYDWDKLLAGASVRQK